MISMTKYTKKEINFTVFVLHRLANRWRMTTPETYRMLTDADILDGYLLPCYDTLHTLGEEYLLDDITDFAREKGLPV
jgi:hypothetical protein